MLSKLLKLSLKNAMFIMASHFVTFGIMTFGALSAFSDRLDVQGGTLGQIAVSALMASFFCCGFSIPSVIMFSGLMALDQTKEEAQDGQI